MMKRIREKLIRWLGGIIGKELYEKEREFEREKARLEAEIIRLAELSDHTPEDCSRGAWCQECRYSKRVRMFIGPSGFLRDLYYCTRGDFCQQFKEKEIVEK